MNKAVAAVIVNKISDATILDLLSRLPEGSRITRNDDEDEENWEISLPVDGRVNPCRFDAATMHEVFALAKEEIDRRTLNTYCVFATPKDPKSKRDALERTAFAQVILPKSKHHRFIKFNDDAVFEFQTRGGKKDGAYYQIAVHHLDLDEWGFANRQEIYDSVSGQTIAFEVTSAPTPTENLDYQPGLSDPDEVPPSPLKGNNDTRMVTNPTIDPNKEDPTAEELLWECLHNFESSNSTTVLSISGQHYTLDNSHILQRLQKKLGIEKS